MAVLLREGAEGPLGESVDGPLGESVDGPLYETRGPLMPTCVLLLALCENEIQNGPPDAEKSSWTKCDPKFR